MELSGPLLSPSSEKKAPRKKSYCILRNETFLPQRNLIKNFLWRNWILEEHSLFTGCSSIQNTFPKLLLQKYIFKTFFSKNINFISFITLHQNY